MNIKYEDITAIMHVVCYADVLLDSKIKELEQKDSTMLQTNIALKRRNKGRGMHSKNKGRTSFEG